MRISVNINNEYKEWEIEPGDILLDVLRREGYKGVKKGCGQGECGACAVLLNGRSVNSCMVLAADVDGMDIITIEGIGTPDNPDILQKTMVEEGAVQCGFCTPGMIISSKYMFSRIANPDEETIKKYLDGNYCRCTGYVKIIKAVKKVANKKKG